MLRGEGQRLTCAIAAKDANVSIKVPNAREGVTNAILLTDEQYNDLLNNQDNKCAICKQFLEIPHVDHDHNCCPSGVSCGQCVRGVLCKHCNIGISHFKDNPEYLQAAADYLKLMVASTISSTLIAQQCP